MTQEEKQLLLIDLCDRLPYGVMVQLLKQKIKPQKLECVADDYSVSFTNDDFFGLIYLDDIKPYLRPMSSMTEEEKDFVYNGHIDFWIKEDYCNEHHLDYRSLIPKNLALEAPEGMYNNLKYVNYDTYL